MAHMSREDARELGIEVPEDEEQGGGGDARRSAPHKREIERARRACRRHPHLYIYVTDQVGKNHGTPGIPDCLFFYVPPRGRERFVFWECKASEGDSLRPAQKAFLALCEVVGIDTVTGTADELLDDLGI